MGRTTTCGDHQGSPATIQWLSTMRVKTDAAGHKTEGLKNRKAHQLKQVLKYKVTLKQKVTQKFKTKTKWNVWRRQRPKITAYTNNKEETTNQLKIYETG